MKTSIIFTLLCIIPLLYFGCLCDCDGSENSASIRILNRLDSTDLFFGEERKYDADETKFFGLKDGDTTFLFHDIAIILQDTVLNIDFGYNVDTAFMKYGDGDIDTFTLVRKTYDSDCCGTTTKVEQLTFNDTTLMENSFPFVTLFK